MSSRSGSILLFLLPLMLLPSAMSAQEGYITTYGHEIEKGEVEFMLMFDHTNPSVPDKEEGQREFLSQMPKIGFNPTDKLELEFMVEGFEEFGTGITRFTGFRFETRYRLVKKEIPLNPTIYFEYEGLSAETRFKMETSGWMNPPYAEEEEEADREKILESRLILSQNIKNWNVAFNWINELDTRSGYTAFGYSFGLMNKIHSHAKSEMFICPMHPEIISSVPGTCISCGMNLLKKGDNRHLQPGSFAFEFLGTAGDTKNAGIDFSRQEHYFQPSVMLHLKNNSMVVVGFAIGLTEASDDLVRIMWMKMF
ncbi:MAG: hypothetical protein HYY40_08235 [Bacteroidetes bacterium]|nr:hypothetical protein [Bacteroidota bacterium]